MIYAALLSAVVVFAHLSRSRQITAAAYFLLAGWLLTIFVWWAIGHGGQHWGYAIIDFVLAIIFWRMSKGHWFPVPLFFIHAIQVVYYLYASLVGLTPWWLAAFLNRVLEVEIVYIIGCALYRIWRLRKSSSRFSP